ncbi:hypothetical protein GCM10022205_42440 [Spinactinospora alkalitolerans]|uniref:hypothetical protein n=1 Tax=Spinactinospora alkalitolerans TaxID=687207 RepID=UPI0031DD4DA3
MSGRRGRSRFDALKRNAGASPGGPSGRSGPRGAAATAPRSASGLRRGLGAAAIAALVPAAAACGGADGTAAAPEGGPSPDSTYGGAMPAAQAPAPEGFTPVEIEGIKINAPEGWEVDDADGRLCMRPPGQAACAYGSLQVLPHVAERDPDKWPKKGDAFDKKNGWASDPTACRSLNTAEAGDVKVKEAEQQTLPDPFTTHADGLKSHHSAWTVTCENNDTFEVRLWFLPTSDVAVYVWSVDARYAAVYDEIATSMDVTEYNE